MDCVKFWADCLACLTASCFFGTMPNYTTACYPSLADFDRVWTFILPPGNEDLCNTRPDPTTNGTTSTTTTSTPEIRVEANWVQVLCKLVFCKFFANFNSFSSCTFTCSFNNVVPSLVVCGVLLGLQELGRNPDMVRGAGPPPFRPKFVDCCPNVLWTKRAHCKGPGRAAQDLGPSCSSMEKFFKSPLPYRRP